MSRLKAGGLIDRSRPLNFSFDRRCYQGFAGDTLASALLANGVRHIGRSFKYHRPRGILTAGGEEPNALVTLRPGARAEPNTRATTAELYDGLVAQSQNRWPSLAFDIMAVNDLLSPLFAAGFYYKTFMWPSAFWEAIYEPLIRRAAGLGALSGEPDPDSYDTHHGFCDLLVIGAGPAGLAAALAAGRSGARVCVVEEDFRCGGRLLGERHEIDAAPGPAWASAAEDELRAMSNVRVLLRACAFAAFDGGGFGIVQRLNDDAPAPRPGAPRQRLWKIVAKRAILASGALERHLVFSGNDRPGVMNASAVQAYVNRYGVTPGRAIAVYTTSDSGWAVVNDLLAAGVAVSAVIDGRPETAADTAKARAAGALLFFGAAVINTIGAKSLRAIDVLDRSGREQRIGADTLAMAGGWTPNFALASHKGARPAWDEEAGVYLMANPPAGMRLAGAAAGRFGLPDVLADGFSAGASAAAELGFRPPRPPPFTTSEEKTDARLAWRTPVKRGKAFVDFQHDVTDDDVKLAAREGYVSVEHMKRYTTLGMATDQGKTSQVLGNAILAEATGQAMDKVGTILARPPASPIPIGVLAGHHRGEHFRPVRKTASHDWAQARGAPFVDAGLWKRAQFFPKPGEAEWLQTVRREAAHVRRHVGVCDVSTLGKIDVQGPDAGILLDRLYINTFSNLAVGKARYGVMLREDGFVFDDGTTTRFAADRYFVTTTTANAARAMQHIDFCREVLWPELDVQAVSATEHWAQFAVAGPKSRALVQALAPDIDMSNGGFPFMAAREFVWHGVPARVFRISFSGELAYEIAVPAKYSAALLEAILASGAPLQVEPYGVETLSVLRIEKGHCAGGELSGQTTASDLGLAKMMSKRKDYIGRVMAERPALNDPNRPQLVGVKPVLPNVRIHAGAHVLALEASACGANDQGYLTSCAYSPALGAWISLALIANGRARIGQRVRAYDPLRQSDVEVEVCNPVFFDPEGERLRA
jgi:sarcosine oxidase subunit alpha